MVDKLVIFTLLEVLDQSEGHSMPTDLILTYVNIKLDNAVTLETFNEQRRFARERGWIDYRINDLNEKRWFITDEGQVFLRKKG